MGEEKTVLIFEDDKDEQMRRLWEAQFRFKVNLIIFVDTIPNLEREFVDNMGLDAIVLAPHQVRNVVLAKNLLEKEMRKNFKGPIIVTTSNPNTKNTLMEAGCNHWCEKRDLPAMVLQILDL